MGRKKFLEREKFLATSNVSFSHSVFRKLVLQTHKNQGLSWKGLLDTYGTGRPTIFCQIQSFLPLSRNKKKKKNSCFFYVTDVMGGNYSAPAPVTPSSDDNLREELEREKEKIKEVGDLFRCFSP